jgi:uncharacterized protein YdaU (DUF1376 family)
MHYYQFNIGDYSSHTKGLSPIEDLAYRRMIDEYYLSEQAFNGCSTDVARLIGLREYHQEVDYVLGRYFTKEGDLWVHGRIDSDIEDYHQKQEKRSNAGKKSAEARQNKSPVQQVLNGCSSSVELTNNYKPITNNQELIVKDKAIGKPLVNFSRWLEIIKEQGEKPIPEDSPIFEYAQDAGIDSDYLRLAWVEFKARYSEDAKKYKDWRAVFSKAVRGNWFKLWWHDGTGYQLTTLGQQNMTAMKNRDKREDQ